MKFKINNKIEFVFDSNDKKYNDLITYFKNNYLNIMDFFGIKNLKKPLIIRINDNYDDFKKQCAINNNIQIDEVPFYAIGYAKDDKEDSISYINHLSLKEVKKIDYFKDKTEDDFNKGIMHEFVHICHFQMCNYDFKGEEWISEGIATYLSKQYENATFTASITDIKNHKTIEYHNYRALFDILMNTYSHDEIINILKGNYSKTLIDQILS